MEIDLNTIECSSSLELASVLGVCVIDCCRPLIDVGPTKKSCRPLIAVALASGFSKVSGPKARVRGR